MHDKVAIKIDLHPGKNLFEIRFGWRDIVQNNILKYGGGNFKIKCLAEKELLTTTNFQTIKNNERDYDNDNRWAALTMYSILCRLTRKYVSSNNIIQGWPSKAYFQP